MLKPLFLGLLLLTATPPSAHADVNGAAFRERMVCLPLKLAATDKSAALGLTLDIETAAADIAQNSVIREYEFPGGEVRVTFTLRYLAQPARVEFSKLYMKLVRTLNGGKSWALMMTFASPMTLDLAEMANVSYVLKGGDKTGPIPEFDTECNLVRTPVDKNCASCR